MLATPPTLHGLHGSGDTCQIDVEQIWRCRNQGLVWIAYPTPNPMRAQTYEEFRESWLEEIAARNLSSTEKGRQFAAKLVNDWLDLSYDSDDIIHCDGANDGGIDIAFLVRAESGGQDDSERQGDTWYLVQSKFGAAFQSTGTILTEGQKVVDTLDGQRGRLNSLAEGLLEKIANFKSAASDADRIVLVYATVDPLTPDEERACHDVRNMGRARLGGLFDTEAVCVNTLFERLTEREAAGDRIELAMRIAGVQAQENVLVGAVSLKGFYDFMLAYRDQSRDLARLYERNVRMFLGARGRVNARMRKTLEESPENFILFNNGITIVVSDFTKASDSAVSLMNPYIVNGCQTSQTIWGICDARFASGGTGDSAHLQEWRRRAEHSFVLVKLVKTGSDGDSLLADITRFTNTQNAVREKDFLSLERLLQEWATQLREKYRLYLEIQRGGWDAERTRGSAEAPYAHHAKALDLIKAYCAGWREVPGPAWNKNPRFLPNGVEFAKVSSEEGFGIDDLWAAFQLIQIADRAKFGRGGPAPRKITRFVFYFVFIRLLRDLLRLGTDASGNRVISKVVYLLSEPTNEAVRNAVVDSALQVIDDYMTDRGDRDDLCVSNEPSFQEVYSANINSFLKAEKFGSPDLSPRLRESMRVALRQLQTKQRGEPSVRDQLIAIAGGAGETANGQG